MYHVDNKEAPIPILWKWGVFLLRKLFKHQNTPDYILLGVIFALLLVGIVKVYSSSYIWADYKYADTLFFVKRQVRFVGVGVIVMIFIMLFPYGTCTKYEKIVLGLCFFLFILVFIPWIAVVR